MFFKKDIIRYKLFLSDTRLFITLDFINKKYTENIIYNKLLSDKLEANLEFVYKTAVAQILVSKGYKLFYYTIKRETSNRLYEVDFLISEGDKISPIEVKSGNYRQHKSQEVFCEKFSRRVKNKYVIHTKNYTFANGIHYLPVYMVPFFLTPEDLRYQGIKAHEYNMTVS